MSQLGVISSASVPSIWYAFPFLPNRFLGPTQFVGMGGCLGKHPSWSRLVPQLMKYANYTSFAWINECNLKLLLNLHHWVGSKSINPYTNGLLDRGRREE